MYECELLCIIDRTEVKWYKLKYSTEFLLPCKSVQLNNTAHDSFFLHSSLYIWTPKKHKMKQKKKKKDLQLQREMLNHTETHPKLVPRNYDVG